MNNAGEPLLNGAIDVGADFYSFTNSYFAANKLTTFDRAAQKGELEWRRRARKPRMAFEQVVAPFEDVSGWEFPKEYDENPRLPIQIDFITPRTIRLRLSSVGPIVDRPSMMLSGPVPRDQSWVGSEQEGKITYASAAGSVIVEKDPWHFWLLDRQGRLLTQTIHLADTFNLLNSNPIPFSFVRRVADTQRRIAASFKLAPQEMIFGGGESFTRLNKRGQKLVLWTEDAHGVQSRAMYKPIPFFMSSRGYGMFVHTGAPTTLDIGHSYDEALTVFSGDSALDLFIFLGTPKQILSEYTALTGRSEVPPAWSFGLWMSRITYKSEAEVREVAARLRQERIPCDVIHLDTGWFEKDWRCNYEFSSTRFDDPAKMIADLRSQGFHISLWQLPYFTPKNELFSEAIAKGYVVRAADGGLPTEDAVLDFSNPAAVKWYQGLLAKVLSMGVECIKADFGEGAPMHGQYASGRSGWFEHNLYPLRYNDAVMAVTKSVAGSNILWGRSAWAGSQRYPLHWGGDAENTDSGMASSLRGGLSLGLCGFTFWSHDIGGFVKKSPAELYLRWLAMGMLTSHSRCHGFPPKEPWNYGTDFTNDFRRMVEFKYRLMPYILEQARRSSADGYPMMRTLFFEFPDDPASWLIEDEYLFGSDLLVAPLFEQSDRRRVYVPPGEWRDYQTNQRYAGERWYEMKVGEMPIIVLARAGATITEGPIAQSISAMNLNA